MTQWLLLPHKDAHFGWYSLCSQRWTCCEMNRPQKVNLLQWAIHSVICKWFHVLETPKWNFNPYHPCLMHSIETLGYNGLERQMLKRQNRYFTYIVIFFATILNPLILFCRGFFYAFVLPLFIHLVGLNSLQRRIMVQQLWSWTTMALKHLYPSGTPQLTICISDFCTILLEIMIPLLKLSALCPMTR